MHRRRQERNGSLPSSVSVGGTGRFQATREGFGFVQPEGGGPEVFVPIAETHRALHGDRVEYRVVREARGTWLAEAVVLRIVARGFQRFTGEVAGPARRPYLVPDHPRLPPRLRLVGALGGVEAGQRVLCELHDAGGRSGPAAQLVRVLGDASDARLDTAIVETEFALPGAYPESAVEEAERVQRERAPAAAGERRDFSGEAVITIDPVDAADFDDAVSLVREPAGTWRLRVHIADVAAGVPRGGVLDAEARRRGNSTYLPGRMIPMLPHVLATDWMSLAPGVPRDVLSVSLRLSPEGRVLGTRIDEGRIVSRQRLDYDRVQAVLDGRASCEAELAETLRGMDSLAQAVRARRMARGAFDLEVPETEIVLDDQGVPSEIRRRRQERSHQLIEEFMILANRAACAWARRRGHPYLFRVHDPPNPLALDAFAEEVRALAPAARGPDFADLPALRRWLGGLPREPRTWRIHGLFLRALKRAVYAPADRGHFGLGLRGYGHFTSPIRRYPDLFNHRVVKWSLRYGARPLPADWHAEASAIAAACTGTEERSERAERELVRIKCLRWAERRLGACFRATVLGVDRPGYFVELDPVPVDGFVPRGEAEAALGGERRGRRAGPGCGDLEMGDPLIVQIARVSLRERSLLLAIRAAGRRALETDPATLEALVDPWTGPPRPGEPRGRRERRGGPPVRPRGERRRAGTAPRGRGDRKRRKGR
jgi:ribonuclease R